MFGPVSSVSAHSVARTLAPPCSVAPQRVAGHHRYLPLHDGCDAVNRVPEVGALLTAHTTDPTLAMLASIRSLRRSNAVAPPASGIWPAGCGRGTVANRQTNRILPCCHRHDVVRRMRQKKFELSPLALMVSPPAPRPPPALATAHHTCLSIDIGVWAWSWCSSTHVVPVRFGAAFHSCLLQESAAELSLQLSQSRKTNQRCTACGANECGRHKRNTFVDVDSIKISSAIDHEVAALVNIVLEIYVEPWYMNMSEGEPHPLIIIIPAISHNHQCCPLQAYGSCRSWLPRVTWPFSCRSRLPCPLLLLC